MTVVLGDDAYAPRTVVAMGFPWVPTHTCNSRRGMTVSDDVTFNTAISPAVPLVGDMTWGGRDVGLRQCPYYDLTAHPPTT